MPDVALINMEYRVDSQGICHLVPIRDLVKHKLYGCTCGCFPMRMKLPGIQDLSEGHGLLDDILRGELDMPLDESPFCLDEGGEDLPEVIVHVAKDARDRIAEVLTFDYVQSIASRRRYVKQIKELSKELQWNFMKERSYITAMDCAFVARWNTN